MQVKMMVVALVVFLSPVIVFAETAAESFARGESLLAKGDFAAAMNSFAAAAQADQSNQEYRQHFALVRRIINLRSRLADEKNMQRWEYIAKALRAFYASELIYPEMLKLDQQMHQRLATADTAAALAETQLSMNLEKEAIATLTGLEANKSTPFTQALLGIAMLRSGKTEEAKEIAAKVKIADDANPQLQYVAARLCAGTGDTTQALRLLKKSFENTAPSLLDGFKAHARSCSEFSAIASGSEFAAVMGTNSLVPESRCSGGRSCAGCPMRGTCPKSQGGK